ncbi:unnamed protein product [Rhizophagus irregularis]|nr:unnamed protein product [Rhizophagus irregularis]CAB5329329.1 unnamed protein product [Rhizophagus irregularis]
MRNRSEKQHYMRQELQKHTSILEQLQSAYKELKNWKILGKRYIQKDVDRINNNKITLTDEFVRIRSQLEVNVNVLVKFLIH